MCGQTKLSGNMAVTFQLLNLFFVLVAVCTAGACEPSAVNTQLTPI